MTYSSTRGGFAECHQCHQWFATPDDWQAHYRECWVGWSESERAPASKQRRKQRSRHLSASIFDELRRGLWMSAAKLGHLAWVLQKHSLYTVAELKQLSRGEFKLLTQDLACTLLSGRLNLMRDSCV